MRGRSVYEEQVIVMLEKLTGVDDWRVQGEPLGVLEFFSDGPAGSYVLSRGQDAHPAWGFSIDVHEAEAWGRGWTPQDAVVDGVNEYRLALTERLAHLGLEVLPAPPDQGGKYGVIVLPQEQGALLKRIFNRGFWELRNEVSQEDAASIRHRIKAAFRR